MRIELGGKGKEAGYPFEIEFYKAIEELDRAIGNLIISEKKFRLSGQPKHENMTMRLRIDLEKIRNNLLAFPSVWI